MKKEKVLIYCDYGTNNISNLEDELKKYFIPRGIAVETTDAKSIIKENSLNESVLAFFMPGGRATPYRMKLQELGNEKIKQYVKNGGIYFGICAGAYYASRQVYFEKDIKELAIIHQCGLNLLNADAIGTLYKEFGISPYTQDFYSMTPATVRWLEDNERHIISYHGGPYFKFDKESGIKVLAEYEIGDIKLPAVIMEQYHQGFAIGVGLHFEDSAEQLEKFLFSNRPDKQRADRVIKILRKYEETRKTFIQKMMQKIR